MIAFFLSLFFFFGCTPSITFNQYDTYLYEVPQTDGGAEALPGSEGDSTSAPFSTTTDAQSLALDVFGTDGNVYWYTVLPEQVDAMNTNWQDSWWGGGADYTVDGESTYADPVMIMTADGEAADFGKIETWIIGQSTGYEWSETTIPNIRVDADQFQDDLKIGGYEHLRFNNAQVGSMLAEPVALALYNAVGYPAPQTSYAFVGGSPWNDNELLIPMIASEVYKTTFCDEHADFFGGGCESIWEGWGGDLTTDSVATLSSQCQDGSCDDSRMQELAQVASDHMYLEDFEAATSEYIDWPALHAFQCMSWLLWTGDDAFHNFNNILLVLGDDGKFRYMPYSVDISAGMAWEGSYSDIPLYGYSAVPTGCQYDPTCWQETLDTCSALIDQIEALNPATTIVDQVYNRLATTKAPYGDDGGDGMLRDGDDERYELIHTFYANRWEEARAELANYPVMTFNTGCGDTGVVPPPGGGQAYPGETGCW